MRRLLYILIAIILPGFALFYFYHLAKTRATGAAGGAIGVSQASINEAAGILANAPGGVTVQRTGAGAVAGSIPVIHVPTFDPNSSHQTPPIDTTGSDAAVNNPVSVYGQKIPVVGSLIGYAVKALGAVLLGGEALSAALQPCPYSDAQLAWINGDPLKAAAINGGQTAVESMLNFGKNKTGSVNTIASRPATAGQSQAGKFAAQENGP